MELSVSILGAGLTWPQWKQYVDGVEKMGFAGLYLADHFMVIDPPPVLDALELTVALTYLADHSQSLHFGSMVSPFSFRDPVFLARQAMALNDLSGSRMILGVGAGWMEREHTMFGYELGNVSTRLDRMEEGLAVVSQLIRSEAPVTFDGRFYQLQEAELRPRPKDAPPILVGGDGPKRTIPMAARYADIWNCQGSVELFKDRSALLDEHLQAEGRDPNDVKRTVLGRVICYRDEAELEQRMSHIRHTFPEWANLPTPELAELLYTRYRIIIDSPEAITRHLNQYAQAGAEEMIILWFGVGDIEGLAIIAEDVLPRLI